MEIVQAAGADLPGIYEVYRNAISKMNAEGIFQWDDIYPDEEILRMDIEKGNLYIGLVDKDIAAAFVLNQDCDRAYEAIRWQCGGTTYFVVHRLCVNPSCQGKGIGTQAMLAAEAIIQEKGGASVRLDAFSLNPAALRLYEKLGYQKVGEAQFRKGLFYLYEKKL